MSNNEGSDAQPDKRNLGSTTATKERTPRINDTDWLDIRKASRARGLSTGDYIVWLHNSKKYRASRSIAAAASSASVENALTQFTRAVMRSDHLSDDTLEQLLDIHQVITHIIETA